MDIKIPEICKPGLDTTLGYSGGMALYVANWQSVMYLFQITNVPLLAYYTIETTQFN
jgi:hypothetical protein